MPTFTLNGEEIEFRDGESIIEAATRLGTEIPYYCWHPNLSVAANCRMCLVEVVDAPKLLPACQTAVREGMVVNTHNERVEEAQAAVHEFLLINHPIDCPICDQAGECKLQDYYMKFHKKPSRMDLRKVDKPRLEQFGPHVLYNAERCVMCTRCVRFMDEVAQNSQLAVLNRGDHSEIGLAHGEALDDPYSLNTVDVCPVGALTSSVFRFKQRVWNLVRTNSVCGGCARGCNIHVEQRSGVVYRFLPRANDYVNEAWLCDEGRLTYEQPNQAVLAECTMTRDGIIRPTRESVAFPAAVERLQAAGKGMALALSLHATVEDAYAVARFARDVIGTDEVHLYGREDGEADEILRVADKNPNRRGIEWVFGDMGIRVVGLDVLAKAKGILAIGHESDDLEPIAARAAPMGAVVHLAWSRTALAEVAHVTLPILSWVQRDGTWVNVDGRAQALEPSHPGRYAARPTFEWLGRLAEALEAPGALALDLASPRTIRARIEAECPSFGPGSLTDLPLNGRLLGGGEDAPVKLAQRVNAHLVRRGKAAG